MKSIFKTIVASIALAGFSNSMQPAGQGELLIVNQVHHRDLEAGMIDQEEAPRGILFPFSLYLVYGAARCIGETRSLVEHLIYSVPSFELARRFCCVR